MKIIQIYCILTIVIHVTSAAISPVFAQDEEKAGEKKQQVKQQTTKPKPVKATTRVKQSRLGLTIKGNQELPNVLYIVPWKAGPKHDVSPIQGRIVEEVFGPVEPHVFKRKIKLYKALQKQPGNDKK